MPQPHLPPVALQEALQYTDALAVRHVRNVCRAWRAATEAPGFWATQCEVRGVGPVRPLRGVTHRVFLEGFDLVSGDHGGGSAQWLVWYNTDTGRWALNPDLLDTWSRATAAPAPVATIAFCPADARPDTRAHTAEILSACMRARDAEAAFNNPAVDPAAGRVGIQVWTNPTVLADGSRAVFMLPCGLAAEDADEGDAAATPAAGGGTGDDGAAARQSLTDARETLRTLTLALTSAVFVVDDAVGTAGRQWWRHVFPKANPLTPYTPAATGPAGGDADGDGEGAVADTTPAARAIAARLRAQATAGICLGRPGKLYVVSPREDLSLAVFDAADVAADRASVAAWVSHFSEVVFLPTAPADAPGDWAAALADDCFCALSPTHYGLGVPRYQPGAVWPELGGMKASLPQWTTLLKLLVKTQNDAIEEDADSPGVLFGSLVGKQAMSEAMAHDVDAVLLFYEKAMWVEIDDGSAKVLELARKGEAAQAPLTCPAPLPSRALIEAHEQHFFAACRRLHFALAAVGFAVPDAMQHFEVLKNRISDLFREVWAINQRRSKHFCAATFDHLMHPLVCRYAPLLPDFDGASSDTDAEEGDVVGPSAAGHQLQLQQPASFYEPKPAAAGGDSVAPLQVSSSSSTAPVPTASGPAGADEAEEEEAVPHAPSAGPAGTVRAKATEWGAGLLDYLKGEGIDEAQRDVKMDTKYLKRFYASFVDRLDEYEMKAIGGRRGDVMLDKSNDLLVRIEASQHHGFKRSDIELATQQLVSDVAARVQRITSEMEQTRSGMQKTCALYTKLLGMQMRQQLAGSLRGAWEDARAWYPAQHDMQLRVYAAVLGFDDDFTAIEAAVDLTPVPDRVETTVTDLAETEANAASSMSAFVSALPSCEKAQCHRFGVVPTPTAAAAQETRVHKAGRFFSKVTAKVSSKVGKFKLPGKA